MPLAGLMFPDIVGIGDDHFLLTEVPLLTCPLYSPSCPVFRFVKEILWLVLCFQTLLVLGRAALAKANPSLRLCYAQRIYFPQTPAPNKETNYTSGLANRIRISWPHHPFKGNTICVRIQTLCL